jgi:hypothetical protein
MTMMPNSTFISQFLACLLIRSSMMRPPRRKNWHEIACPANVVQAYGNFNVFFEKCID